MEWSDLNSDHNEQTDNIKLLNWNLHCRSHTNKQHYVFETWKVITVSVDFKSDHIKQTRFVGDQNIGIEIAAT